MRTAIEELLRSGYFLGPSGPIDSINDLTTTMLVEQWIKKPETSGTSRLADVPEIISPADIGTPTYFISHAWKGSFGVLVANLVRCL